MKNWKYIGAVALLLVVLAGWVFSVKAIRDENPGRHLGQATIDNIRKVVATDGVLVSPTNDLIITSETLELEIGKLLKRSGPEVQPLTRQTHQCANRAAEDCTLRAGSRE